MPTAETADAVPQPRTTKPTLEVLLCMITQKKLNRRTRKWTGTDHTAVHEHDAPVYNVTRVPG